MDKEKKKRVDNRPLTHKQEAFAQKYVELGDATAAYRFAYNTEKMKTDTIYKRAHELVFDGKVSGRIAELKAKASAIAEKKFEITIEQRLRWLEQIAKAGMKEYTDIGGSKRSDNLGASNGAIKIMNEMLKDAGDGGAALSKIKIEIVSSDDGDN